jgi:hypothetical protein
MGLVTVPGSVDVILSFLDVKCVAAQGVLAVKRGNEMHQSVR